MITKHKFYILITFGLISTAFLFQNNTLLPIFQFKIVKTFVALGGASEQQLAYLDDNGKPHLLIGHSYPKSIAELVDFSSNETKSYPLPDTRDENGAPFYQGIYAILRDEDTLYISTSPRGVILSFDMRNKRFTPIGGELVPYEKDGAFSWDLVMGPDRVIYGCAYPRATFFKIDLKDAIPKLEIIAKLEDPEHKAQSPYARFLAVGSEGFIYIKTGLTKSNSVLYFYDPNSKASPTPVQFKGGIQASLIRSFHLYDDKLYAKADLYTQTDSNILATEKYVELFKGVAQPTTISTPFLSRIDELRTIPGKGYFSKFNDGQKEIKWSIDEKNSQSYSYPYSGKPLSIFRLGLGPNNHIYGSTALPSNFFEYHENKIRVLQIMGPGEAYSITPLGNKVLIGAYSVDQAIKLWDPAEDKMKNVKPDPKYAIPTGWRTFAAATSIDKKTTWLGSVPSYEQKAGHLVEVSSNLETPINVSFPVENLSISSIETISANQNTYLFLGTSILLGSGTRPILENAKLQVWKNSDKKIVSTLDLNFPGYSIESFFNLIRLSDGSLFGMAALKNNSSNNTVFSYGVFVAKFDSNTESLILINNKLLPDISINHKITLNSISSGGKFLYGLYNGGIFAIDPTTMTFRKYPYNGPITAGFVKRGKGFYFGSGANIVRFSFFETDF